SDPMVEATQSAANPGTSAGGGSVPWVATRTTNRRWSTAMTPARRLAQTLTRLGIMTLSGLLAFPATASSQAPQHGPSGPDRPAASATARPTPSSASGARHPLDPLEPDEIQQAVAIVRKERQPGDSVRFVTVTLNEPPKEVVRHPRPAGRSPREAFVI